MPGKSLHIQQFVAWKPCEWNVIQIQNLGSRMHLAKIVTPTARRKLNPKGIILVDNRRHKPL